MVAGARTRVALSSIFSKAVPNSRAASVLSMFDIFSSAVAASPHRSTAAWSSHYVLLFAIATVSIARPHVKAKHKAE